jgi:ribosomal protein S2
MLGCSMYLGRYRRDWTSLCEQYLSGYRNKFSIFDLSQTGFYLARATSFVEGCAARRRSGFFYGLIYKNDKNDIFRLIRINQIVTTRAWIGGFITNIRNFHKHVGNFKKVPSYAVAFSFDRENYSLVREGLRVRLPVVAPVDSNSDPQALMYPIPSNSSNFASKEMYCYVFTRAVYFGIAGAIRGFRKKKKRFNIRKFGYGRRWN